MKKYLIQVMLVTFVALSTSCGNNTEKKDSTEVAEDKNEHKFDDNKKEDDREFLVSAASGGMMEVELGKLAQTQASSADVKKFGQQMIDDHSKGNDELKTLAAGKNISIPTAPGEKHQKHINELKEKSGADFDKAYMSLMVDDHQDDIDEFEKESNNGNDADIKAFAAKTVPVLKQHLEMAKTINDRIK